MDKKLKKISSLLLNLPVVFTLGQNVNAMNAIKTRRPANYDDHDERASELKHYVEKNLNYKIVKELKVGLLKVVYLATDSSGKEVALKFTNSDAHIVDRKAKEVKRYLGDMDLYDKLKAIEETKKTKIDLGPGICKILGYDYVPVSKDSSYDVCVELEYIKGETLADYIKNYKYSSNDVLKWLKDICDSLIKMHELGFENGEINIWNVMLKDNKAILVDFGRAFDYKKYLGAPPRGYVVFHKDLVALRRLIESIDICVNCTDRESDNYKKLMSLRESKTFDEFYENLRKIA